MTGRKVQRIQQRVKLSDEISGRHRSQRFVEVGGGRAEEFGGLRQHL